MTAVGDAFSAQARIDVPAARHDTGGTNEFGERPVTDQDLSGPCMLQPGQRRFAT